MILLDALSRWRCRRWLVDHFAGALSPSRERQLRQRLTHCAETRALYAAMSLAEQAGACVRSSASSAWSPEPTCQHRRQRLHSALFGPEERGERALGARRRPLMIALSLATACAALLVATLLVPLGQTDDADQPSSWTRSTFRAKSATGASGDVDRHVSISVYQRDATGALRQVADGQRVRSGVGLAFAYSNRSRRGFDRLLLFAVDETHTVYWFYPAWTDPDTDPRATPITPAADVELGEEITHDFKGSRIRIVALFTDDTKLSVSRVESIIAQMTIAGTPLDAIERLPLPATGQHTLSFEVSR